MSRAEVYEMLVEGLTHDEFVTLFDCEPADIQALDYNFDTDVTWNIYFEMAYDMYIND